MADDAVVLADVNKPPDEVAVGVVDLAALLDRAPQAPGDLASHRLGQRTEVQPPEAVVPGRQRAVVAGRRRVERCHPAPHPLDPPRGADDFTGLRDYQIVARGGGLEVLYGIRRGGDQPGAIWRARVMP